MELDCAAGDRGVVDDVEAATQRARSVAAGVPVLPLVGLCSSRATGREDGQPPGHRPTYGQGVADQRCVVFDLDGTLLASDSVRNLILHVLGRSPVRLSLALLTSPMWLALGVRRATRLQAERVVLWSVTVGRSATDFAELVREFAAEYAGESSGRRHTVTLQRLAAHRAAGDRVVIATGCAAPLAREICLVLGLRDVAIVASTFRLRRWRLPHAVPARGQQKLVALQEAGFEPPFDHAYSDSIADLPLLRGARTPHLVRPSDKHLRLLLDELGHHVEVLW